MTFGWRRVKATYLKSRKNHDHLSELELTIPPQFRCPISLDLMKDPVTLSTGITYDRESIDRWMDAGNKTCPVTNQVLVTLDQIPNHSLRKMIQNWCVANKSHGIERIPTPKIPLTPSDALQMCCRMAEMHKQRDGINFSELLKKMKSIAKESDRNKKCLVQNGAGSALTTAFDSFASVSMEENIDLLKDILSGLAWILPMDKTGVSKLGSVTSLRRLTCLLNDDDLTVRQNAVIVLKELLSTSQSYADRLIAIECIDQTLLKIVEVPICPRATKATLTVIYLMIASSNNSLKFVQKLVERGLVSVLLEILVDGEKSICEKALGVLDRICNFQQGKEAVCNNALSIPVIVKKILRVSDSATEFAVSVLWKIFRIEGKEEEDFVVEALQVGGFQKVLVVLQIGCGRTTKEKATELLKVMNFYKDRVECFDSNSGFKYLKRSY